MRLIEPTEEYEYFCIRCANMREFKLRTDEPSPFLQGRECPTCNRDVWAYSPPSTTRDNYGP